MAMKLRLICALLCSLLCLSALPAGAEQGFVLQSIQVSGNQRIEASSIESYLGIAVGDVVTSDKLNKAIKALFETGFFADVRLNPAPQSAAIEVIVVENPSLNLLAFEGNDALSSEDLEKEVSLKSRSIYTRTAVQNDVKRLVDIYRRSGYYSVQIVPKIIQQEQNRVDLVYEITEGTKSPIRNITFLGNKAYPASTLQGVINSEESRFYKFLSDSDKYDPDRLEYDKELLRRFYRSRGYADFKVQSAFAELSPDKSAFYLTFTVIEGARYTLGDVTIESSLKGAETDLQPHLLTASGDEYNATHVENTIDKLIAVLGDRGFAFVEIDPVLDKNVKEGTIDLTYSIRQGARVYVERIDITGNIGTLDEVVRREFRLAEGDAYSSTRLQQSEKRLRNLGYFKNVTVATQQGSAPDKVVIAVNIEEQSTGEITLGAGFSTADGPLADVGIRERNLLGRGQDLRFRVLAAAERQQFDIGFTEPYLFNRELMGGVDLYKIQQDYSTESSFDRDSIGGKLRTGYKLSEELQHQQYYAFEQSEITDIDSDASRFIRDQEGKNITSLVGHALVFDNRDNRFTPTEGVMVKGVQEVAGLGGDDKFVRHELQSEYYYPIAPEFVFSLAGAAGHIAAIEDDVRINQRFFIGGRVMRGFDNSGIGPRDFTTGDALGGNMYYVGSVETRFPLGLPEDLGISAALFTDVGSLWDSDDVGPEVVGNDHSLRMASGLGIAWASPFGPIRIDFSVPVIKEEYDETEIFRLNFGTRF